MAEKKKRSLFAESKKINEFSSALGDETSIASVKDFLDTGFYALNAILSGNLLKGIPFGRVTTLFGPSQSGKSLISALLQESAQKKDMTVIIFDSEYDKDGRMEANFGVDLDNVITMPIDTIEDLTQQFTKVITKVIENNEKREYLFVIDSLGFLGSEKELKNALDSKSPMDMGLKAKMLKTFFRNIKGPLAKTECPLVMINHETDNPNQLHDSIFKTQGGGKAIEFISTLMVNVSAKKEKADNTNPLDIESVMTKKNYTGQLIRLFTHKNRVCIPHKEAECYLNFVSGPDRYSGMKPLLDKVDESKLYLKSANGEIGKGFTWYFKDGEEEIKLGKYKEWSHDSEVWEKYLIPVLNEYVQEEFAYKTHR